MRRGWSICGQQVPLPPLTPRRLLAASAPRGEYCSLAPPHHPCCHFHPRSHLVLCSSSGPRWFSLLRRAPSRGHACCSPRPGRMPSWLDWAGPGAALSLGCVKALWGKTGNRNCGLEGSEVGSITPTILSQALASHPWSPCRPHPAIIPCSCPECPLRDSVAIRRAALSHHPQSSLAPAGIAGVLQVNE